MDGKIEFASDSLAFPMPSEQNGFQRLNNPEWNSNEAPIDRNDLMVMNNDSQGRGGTDWTRRSTNIR